MISNQVQTKSFQTQQQFTENNQIKQHQHKKVGDFIITDNVLGKGAYGVVKKGYHVSRPEKLKYLAETEAILFFKHILEGFKTLNAKNIIHRDIKPENILLDNGRAKISDFGFSRVLENGAEQLGYFSRLGTPLYMSPQILEAEQFSAKCDVWSSGILLYEMLYGKTPWSGKNTVQLRANIFKIELTFPQQPQRSAEIQNLIRQMLELKEEKRIDWKTIFQNPLFQTKLVDNSQMSNSNGTFSLSIEYIQNNLVQGYLDKNLNDSEKSKNGDLSAKDIENDKFYATSGLKDKVSAEEAEQNIEIAKRKLILKQNDHMQFERNMAFFFNFPIKKLIENDKKLIHYIGKSLYFREVFLLAKNQMASLQFWKNQLEQDEPIDESAKQTWNIYKSSREYRKTYQQIIDDIKHISKFYDELLEKTEQIIKGEINKLNSQIQQVQNQNDNQQYKYIEEQLQINLNFLKIVDQNFEQSKIFKKIYKSTNMQILDYLIPLISKNPDRQLLMITYYILISKNPYIEFENKDYDFNKFYEEIESSNEKILCQMIFQFMNKLDNKKQTGYSTISMQQTQKSSTIQQQKPQYQKNLQQQQNQNDKNQSNLQNPQKINVN
ncbi:Protein kinase-like domain [Pseudocohnilembus persalinus]|uniref:Protein kinase-like domain n=1 Tax=Pseudocohnilembus persalinus TaxID=266149 RepID=A0A0V0QDE4_PSEPJ|nr:Protein kinase-like domain [Pseudocohnilembus persalinus]|eukprot:KRX00223.1 Protein kinase-like domain [Pseudocohnilembus persalinus]